jgi:hypothetical protein
VGASVGYVKDSNIYGQRLDANGSVSDANLLASTGGLPDTQYIQKTVKLFGKYTLDKSAIVRVDFVHQWVTNNDWTWGTATAPFVYADGTTVAQKPTQLVNYLGVTYTYLWP